MLIIFGSLITIINNNIIYLNFYICSINKRKNYKYFKNIQIIKYIKLIICN